MTVGAESLQRRMIPDGVYTNADHTVDEDVIGQLQGDEGLVAQHSAWDFCGYVYKRGDIWVEEVWQHKALVEVLEGSSPMDVIDQANTRYGYN